MLEMTKIANPELFAAEPQAAVECLGIKFLSDEERREYFLKKLGEKLKDPAFRAIPGFPVGEDVDILAMSDPPYYTACPNPFLDDFVKYNSGTSGASDAEYHQEPFAADVSEGKTDPLYNAHAYHTKVPHKAIMRYVLHYTKPNDVVFDGFCGTGMTGLAARLCDDAPTLTALGLRTGLNGNLVASDGTTFSPKGPRFAILNDLSPVATFIAYNYNTTVKVANFKTEADRILRILAEKCGWMYATLHQPTKSQLTAAIDNLRGKNTSGFSDRTKALPLGRINFTVWSEVFSCGECGHEIVFSEEAVHASTKEVRQTFPCPRCKAELNKKGLNRVYDSTLDPTSRKMVTTTKRKPVLIDYSYRGNKYEKIPDHFDAELLRIIDTLALPESFPVTAMMNSKNTSEPWGDKWRAGTASFTHVHHLFLKRPIQALGEAWHTCANISNPRLRHRAEFLVEQAVWGMSLLARYVPTHYSQVNQYLSGVYYIGSQHAECSPWYILEGKSAKLTKAFSAIAGSKTQQFVTTGHSGKIPLGPNSVDYIFTDPPFGDNLCYAELNFLIECFHRVFTNSGPEAIVSNHQGKSLREYQSLMTAAFSEFHRILKPGRWMTVEFHNSRNSVWNAIQEALQVAGFVVADVRMFDKRQGSFNQIVAAQAVKQDLAISAYKPSLDLEERFRSEAGTEKGVWDFLRSHLKQLPVVVCKGTALETVGERQSYVLFDRMVAFHIQRGVAVPMSAPEFYGRLRKQFIERDGMYFLPGQIAEYDKKRAEVATVGQYELFVSDEKSAIHWVRRELERKRMPFQLIQPLYMKEAQIVWDKHEQPIELQTILEENFIQESDGNWRVPDTKSESDLGRLRNRSLLREFQQYVGQKGKLKVVRTEALRAGFNDCWQRQEYSTIVQVTKRVPETVIEEDPALLMYYDNALMRTGI